MNQVLTPQVLTPVDVLSNTEFFANLTPAQLEKIASISQLRPYEDRSYIYKQGDAASSFYVLVEGTVKFTLGFAGRDASSGDILRRGKVFGWAALTPTASYRIATASCLTPCTVLAINGDGLLSLMERDHTLGFLIMKQLTLLITGTLAAFAAG